MGRSHLQLLASKLEAIHGRHCFTSLGSILELDKGEALALVGVRVAVQVDSFRNIYGNID